MKTLADKIIEAAGEVKRYDMFTIQRLVQTAKFIRSAQRFVVTQDAREAGRQLLLTRPSSLIDAMQWARPPFERCWFEWDTPNHPDPINSTRVRIKQVGCLVDMVRGTDGKAFTFWTAWYYDRNDGVNSVNRLWKQHELERKEIMFNDPGIGSSAVEIGFDMDILLGLPGTVFNRKDGWLAPNKQTAESVAHERNDDHNNVKYALKDPAELEAINRLTAPLRWRLRMDRLSVDQFEVASSMGRDAQVSMVDDVRDECGPLLATLILMNCKNVAELEKYEPDAKLNKAKAKRGKPELIDYTTVHIKFTRREHSAVASGMSRAEARFHRVRGHFKVRKTGVFYWSNFTRGNIEAGKVRHEYKVEK